MTCAVSAATKGRSRSRDLSALSVRFCEMSNIINFAPKTSIIITNFPSPRHVFRIAVLFPRILYYQHLPHHLTKISLSLSLPSHNTQSHPHLNTQSRAHAPPLVNSFNPVTTNALLLSLYCTFSSLTLAPLSVTLLTAFCTPRTVTFARALVSL